MRHAVVAGVLHRAQLQHAGAGGRHLEHLLERDHGQLARVGHDPRVGAEHAGDVGVDLAHVGAQRRRQRHRGGVRPAAAERGHVRRRWTRPGSRPPARSCPRRARRGCGPRARRGCAPWCARCRSRCPACEPVSEIASWPRSLITIAASAHEIRSPVESSMSISRGCGRSETSWAIAISSSVVLPRAESTATTRAPASAACDDPARGALDPLGVGDGRAAELHHHRLGNGAGHGRRRLAFALCPPDEQPPASVPALTLSAGARARARAPGSVVLVGGGRPIVRDHVHGASGARWRRRRPRHGEAADPVRATLQADVAPSARWRRCSSGASAARTPTPPDCPTCRRLDLGGVVIARANYSDPGPAAARSTGRCARAASGSRHVAAGSWRAQEGGEFNAFPDLPPATAPADLDNAAPGRRARRRPAGRRCAGSASTACWRPMLDVGPPDDLAVGAPRLLRRPRRGGRATPGARSPAYRRATRVRRPGHFPGLGAASQPTERGPCQRGPVRRELSSAATSCRFGPRSTRASRHRDLQRPLRLRRLRDARLACRAR